MARARSWLVGLAVLALAAPAVAGAVAPPPDAGGPAAASAGTHAAVPQPRTDSTVALQPRTDNTITRIEVTANGSARWTVRIRTRLATEADVEDYRAFQERFRANTSRFLDPFADRMRGVVEGAEAATGREMAAVGFEASTSIQEVPRRWGVVSFSFTWTNFVLTEGDRLVVGDVFEGGFFLATNDTLAVAAPESYRIDVVEPEPTSRDDDLASWQGRADFADRRPHVEMVPAATPTATPTGTPTGPGAGGIPPALVAVALLAIAAGLGAAYAVRRGRGAAGVGGLLGRGDGDGGDGGDGGEAVMTDAERVEKLLATNGGRMKQSIIAEEIGWSASKTSRVISDMVEAGRVEKLRVGRENIIELAGEREEP